MDRTNTKINQMKIRKERKKQELKLILTPEQKEIIMNNNGVLTHKQVAAKIGLTHNQVTWVLRRFNLIGKREKKVQEIEPEYVVKYITETDFCNCPITGIRFKKIRA